MTRSIVALLLSVLPCLGWAAEAGPVEAEEWLIFLQVASLLGVVLLVVMSLFEVLVFDGLSTFWTTHVVGLGLLLLSLYLPVPVADDGLGLGWDQTVVPTAQWLQSNWPLLLAHLSAVSMGVFLGQVLRRWWSRYRQRTVVAVWKLALVEALVDSLGELDDQVLRQRLEGREHGYEVEGVRTALRGLIEEVGAATVFETLGRQKYSLIEVRQRCKCLIDSHAKNPLITEALGPVRRVFEAMPESLRQAVRELNGLRNLDKTLCAHLDG